MEHARNSAKQFGGRPEDYLAIHRWFESKAFFADFATAPCAITEGFSRERSLTNDAVPSATSENSTLKKTSEGFRRLRTGSHKFGRNVGCTVSD